MIEGRPFLFQSMEDTVYHVAEKGVEVVHWWSLKEKIVAFVDGDDKNNRGPKRILNRFEVQIIVASSPKVSSEKWIKQAGDGSHFNRLAINLWSQKELLIAGLVLVLLFNMRLMSLCRIYSFNGLIFLSSCSGSRLCIAVIILATALPLPHPPLACTK
jgi:hypothetical protein